MGRFLRKRQRKGSQIAAKTDRSEIVPYLGSSSGYIQESFQKNNLSLVAAQTVFELPSTLLGCGHLSWRHEALQIVSRPGRSIHLGGR